MRELYHNIDLDIEPLVDMTMPDRVRHNKLYNENINPKLINLLRAVGICPAGSGIFYSPPGFTTEVLHTDCHISDPHSEWPSIAKLNFIVGEKDTLSMWGDVPLKYRILSSSKSTDINQEYQAYNIRWCENIETYKLFGWHLFEAGIPHTVRNPTKNKKWTISMVMHEIDTWRILTFGEAKSRLLNICLQK